MAKSGGGGGRGGNRAGSSYTRSSPRFQRGGAGGRVGGNARASKREIRQQRQSNIMTRAATAGRSALVFRGTARSVGRTGSRGSAPARF